MKKRKFYFRTLVGAGLIAAAAAFPAFADNWIHQENGWVCKTADGYMQTGWYQDKNNGENGTICGRRQETVWVACRRDGSRRTESGIFLIREADLAERC